VIINALPMPPRNVTELVPLPAQPAQVKVPDVLNVTGSAFAVEAPIAMKQASTAAITIVFINRAMLSISPLSTSFDPGRTLIEQGVETAYESRRLLCPRT
jgi:hypothetical protein